MPSKPKKKPVPVRFWAELPRAKLLIVYGIAKDKKKGLAPFFRDPHEMILLREAANGGRKK